MTSTWSCAIRALPATIEGDPPKPVVGVLWACEGAVVGAQVFEGTHVSDAELAESFEQAAGAPMVQGLGGRPSRVRVACEALARRLRLLLPDVKIEVAPTPDVDEAFDSLADALAAPAGESDAAAAVEALKALDEPVRQELGRVGGEFFDLEPWTALPPDVPVRIRIPSHDVRDGRLSVMGHDGDTYGMMLFRSAEDFDRVYEIGQSQDPGALPTLPTCYSLSFEPVPPELLGYDPVEGEPVLPVITVFERDTERDPSRSEAELVLAATAGINRFVELRELELLFPANWDAGVEGRYRVPVLDRKLEVKLVARR